MDRNCGNVMAFGKFIIPSLIGFNSLTRPSFQSFCMSVTGLKSFESSYCMLKSPARSDKKLCSMFCLVLRNSLTIKSLFLGSVIFRNDMFLLPVFFICSSMVLSMVLNMVLNMALDMVLDMVLDAVLDMVLNMVLDMVLNMVLDMVLNMVLNTNSSGNTNLISSKQFISFSFYITSFFKARLSFYS